MNCLFEEVDFSVDKSIFDLNVFGVVNMSRMCVKHWLANNEKGHLAVTSGGVGHFPLPACSTYVASKHAIHGYFDTLRCELSK